MKSSIELNDLDCAVLLLLTFSKKKGVAFLTEAQINKIIYNLQIKSLEFVGREFCDAQYHRQARGPVSLNVKDSLKKLTESQFIMREDKNIGREKPAHLYSIVVENFASTLSENKALFALSSFQLLEKKFPRFMNGKGEITTLGSYETEPMKRILAVEESSGGGVLLGQSLDLHSVNLNAHVVEILEHE